MNTPFNLSAPYCFSLTYFFRCAIALSGSNIPTRSASEGNRCSVNSPIAFVQGDRNSATCGVAPQLAGAARPMPPGFFSFGCFSSPSLRY